MIDLNSIEIFQKNKCTLKKTSKDEHDNGFKLYLTESCLNVINFDVVKDKYAKPFHLEYCPRSCDALFQSTDCYVFVEFKAGKITKQKQYQILQKIYDSLLIFSDISHLTIGELRNEAEFILVYDEKANLDNTDPELKEKSTQRIQESASLKQFEKTIAGFAKKEITCFGLGFFEKYCFKRVHTFSEKEFDEYLKSNTFL